VKIALIQDQLLTSAGSERVFLSLVEEFAEADVYTLAYNAEVTWPEFKRFKIRTSVLNPLIRTHRQFKWWFPIATYVMQWWDFRDYDVVITSSTTVAKYIKRFRGPQLCYCYFPTRAIWESGKYFGTADSLKARVLAFLMKYLRRRDIAAAQRVTQFVAISEFTRTAIRNHYDRDAVVLPSPIDFERFASKSTLPKEDFFLVVGRLETWKRVDYAIEAFARLGLPLKIVGSGPDEARLRAMASSNVEFLGQVGDEDLARLYARARAVVFTPALEYGLVPLEANAAGTPCIAFGRGGVLETMVGLDDKAGRPPTAVLFDEQTPESLVEAVGTFERTRFDRAALTAHASGYNVGAFKSKMRALLDKMLVETRTAQALPARAQQAR